MAGDDEPKQGEEVQGALHVWPPRTSRLPHERQGRDAHSRQRRLPDDFKGGAEYVFSGHFHFRQAKENIVYTGNIMPFNFADAWDEDRA
jgi:DNA repair exonuclease SbcCD nuclease subunit